VECGHRASSPFEEFRRDHAALDLEMVRHIGEDVRRRADSQARVIWNRDVVLTACRR
jgi:hypothetical protein